MVHDHCRSVKNFVIQTLFRQKLYWQNMNYKMDIPFEKYFSFELVKHVNRDKSIIDSILKMQVKTWI